MILLAPVILFSLTVHEVAHGWVAYKFGDPTAKATGRLTLNPIAHLDPIGTILLFIAHFGWAKPVMVNPYNLDNPKKDMIWISLAGPGSNFALALLSGIALRVLMVSNMDASGLISSSLYAMLILSLQINLALGIFNLIPLPPLDGAKVLFGLLPYHMEERYSWLEKYGMVILLGLFLIDSFTPFRILSFIIWVPANVLSYLFAGRSLYALLGFLNMLLSI